MKNNFDLKNFLVENKLTKNSKALQEGLTVVGHTEEEKKKNAEELVAAAEKAGRKATIEYNTNPGYEDQINTVNIGAPGLGTPAEVRAVQDRQFAEYDKNKPKDTKPSFKAKKLKKLTVGGKTYEKGDSDPNDDGRIMSIEKYPNGYYIQGGIYSDYGDGDGPKEGYGYAIDLKGNEMDEEDLEGMYEGKKSNVNESKSTLSEVSNNNKETKNNFDLKKFLIENKLTTNSRQIVNENKDHDEEILAYIADTYIQNAKDGDSNYAGFLDLNIRDAVQDVVGILQDPKHPLHLETKKEYQIVSRDKARGLFEKKDNLKEEDADFAPSPNSDIPDANAEEYDVATAFKKAGVDMSKPVMVLHSYGSASFGGSDKDEMSAEAAIKKLESERQENQKNFTDDGKEVPSDIHGYEFENHSVLEEEMPEGHEYKLSYFLDGDYTYSITQQ